MDRTHFGGGTRTTRKRSLSAVLVGSFTILAVAIGPVGAANAATDPVGVTPDLGPTAGGTSVSVSLGAHGVTQVASGARSVYARTAEGTVVAWGNGDAGQIGDGSTTTATTPVDVLIPADHTITDVVAGGFSAFAVDADGSFWAWGSNQVGELGNGGGANVTTPEQVRLPGGRSVAQMSAGEGFTVALATDGTAWAWGRNTFGNLGTGTGDTATPARVQVPAGVTFTQVVAGASNSAAVDSDGSVWTWGSNASGQLGNGTTDDAPLPVRAQLPVGVTITSVDVGTSVTAAVAADGTGWAWGLNVFGVLGNGTTDDSSVPIQIDLPVGSDIAALGLGQSFGLATDSDGNGYSWGTNNYGQLADGTQDQRLVPGRFQLPDGRTIAGAVGGVTNGVALADDGTVWTWGQNDTGQLGDGSTTDSAVPVQVDFPFGVTGVTIDGQSVPFTFDPTAGPGGAVTFTTPPHAAGAVDIVVSTSSGDQVADAGFTYADAPAVTSGAVPQGVVGEPYSFAVTATGTGPLSYAVSAGALPDGISLDAATGRLTGTPTTAGTARFTVSVTNAVGTDTQDQALVITSADDGGTPPVVDPGDGNTATPSPGGSGGVTPGDPQGDSDGALAFTGADGQALAAGLVAAALLVGAGMVLLVVRHRRRHRSAR